MAPRLRAGEALLGSEAVEHGSRVGGDLRAQARLVGQASLHRLVRQRYCTTEVSRPKLGNGTLLTHNLSPGMPPREPSCAR